MRSAYDRFPQAFFRDAGFLGANLAGPAPPGETEESDEFNAPKDESQDSAGESTPLDSVDRLSSSVTRSSTLARPCHVLARQRWNGSFIVGSMLNTNPTQPAYPLISSLPPLISIYSSCSIRYRSASTTNGLMLSRYRPVDPACNGVKQRNSSHEKRKFNPINRHKHSTRLSPCENYKSICLLTIAAGPCQASDSRDLILGMRLQPGLLGSGHRASRPWPWRCPGGQPMT